MTFHVIYACGVNACVGVCALEGKDLSFRVGLQKKFSLTVIGETDPFNQRIDLVTISQGIAITLQHEHACTFAGDKATAGFIQRAASAVFRVGLEDGESHIDK